MQSPPAGRGRHMVLPAWMTQGTQNGTGVASSTPAVNGITSSLPPPSIPSQSTGSVTLPGSVSLPTPVPSPSASPAVPTFPAASLSAFGSGANAAPPPSGGSLASSAPSFGLKGPSDLNSGSGATAAETTGQSSPPSAENGVPKKTAYSAIIRRIRDDDSPSRSRSSSPSEGRRRHRRSRSCSSSESVKRKRRSRSGSGRRRGGRHRQSRRSESRSDHEKKRSRRGRRRSRSASRDRSHRKMAKKGSTSNHVSTRGRSRSAERSRERYGKRGSDAGRRNGSPSPDPALQTTAATVADRLLELRQLSRSARAKRRSDLLMCLAKKDEDFYAEDRYGKGYRRDAFVSDMVLNAPETKVRLNKRLFLEASETHSFCVDLEERSGEKDEIILYECVDGRIVRVYCFRDSEGLVREKVPLEKFKKARIYEKAWKYCSRKGVPSGAQHHYFDYVNAPEVVG
ncbi:transcription factor related [Cystoisospora suis]|uniref:Transcription factor related n=1 Tax=Cystoisospora suis TaxID=483139 RepID=A0A2C6KEM8_9APIC|nr:transcription factor related [Cystoisospora suis]